MTARAQPAAVVETHVSVIFFVGDRAYKLKKPVSFDFVDCSTRSARERLCRREVELNRRLAPDVYLGVADITGPDGALADHLVVMRRMPPERCLATLLENAPDTVALHLREIARIMASFHATARRAPEIDATASVDAVASRWDANFDELAGFAETVFDPADLDRARRLITTYLRGREPLFRDRIDAGQICDGHGDLQAADIYCLDDGPRILDCIEFDDRLRFGDVVDDVAFLAMDLEHLGASEQATTFLAAYEEMSGSRFPPSRLDIAIAYRAQVRAKVTALRWAQSDPTTTTASAARDDARALLDLCLDHLERAAVRLWIIGGLPGTGKSTHAARLGDTSGAVVLSSDVVRKELAGLRSTDRTDSSFGAGIYTDERTDEVYAELLRRARALLERGASVILDASWNRAAHRTAARALADASGAELTELRCTAAPGVTAERLRARAARGDDPSDATPAIAAAMATQADPWPEATAIATDHEENVRDNGT